jgi:hypothetical protein
MDIMNSRGLVFFFLMLFSISCKRKSVNVDERRVNEEEVEITNNTSGPVSLQYVDTFNPLMKGSKSFTMNVPGNSIRKLSLGKYYVGESYGFLDFCSLRSVAIMTFQDGKSKSDTSCFAIGGQNFKDSVNFFSKMKIYNVGITDYHKIYTYRYTISDADYSEAK